MKRKDIKTKYEALVAAVTLAIDEADPIGLLKIGAPPDEYSPEVGTVVPRVSHATDVEEVKRILHEEFVRWFGGKIAGPEMTYEALAKQVWQAVLTYREAG